MSDGPYRDGNGTPPKTPKPLWLTLLRFVSLPLLVLISVVWMLIYFPASIAVYCWAWAAGSLDQKAPWWMGLKDEDGPMAVLKRLWR